MYLLDMAGSLLRMSLIRNLVLFLEEEIMLHGLSIAISATVFGLSAAIAQAGSPDVFTASYDEPTFDRWMYPFNATPGVRGSASIFAAFFIDFDDRDSQFVVGFNTSGDIPVDLPVCSYRIVHASFSVENLNNDLFEYDETYDSYATHLPEEDEEWFADEDAGRPIELFGVAYRNEYDAQTFEEGSPFSPGGNTQKDVRNAFATDNFDGLMEDISNNVTTRFETVPFAIGKNSSLTPGQIVPEDTRFVFEIDVTNPDVQRYLASELARGDLRFTVSSLQPASFDGSGGAGQFAAFFTRENLIHQLFGGRAATLDLEVEIVPLGDVDGNGEIDFNDLVAILFEFGNSDGPADVDCSGEVDFNDLVATLFLFTAR